MVTHLAVDFGGGSGRMIAGSVSGDKLEMVEIHRFPNRQIRLGNHLYWDFPYLFEEMKTGIKKAVRHGFNVCSIGIDTWGVDYGLIDANGNLLGNPLCYRDEAFAAPFRDWMRQADVPAHYRTAGIQMMPINTLFQLYSRKQERDVLLDVADKLLFMPCLFGYYLTGVAANEYSIASTSELLDACSRDWNRPLLRQLDFPERLFGTIVPPGHVLGTLRPEIAEETGISPDVKVVAVASHDTASAVYAIPYISGKESVSAFLSSGTWSLLGIELDEPLLTEQARQAGFTNEGGTDGKIRFLQNITGLWILQCLIARWQGKGLPVDYDYLIEEAERAEIASVIDVDHEAFVHPVDMERAIEEYCRERGLEVPSGQGEMVRCVLHSLAVRYKRGIEQLNRILGRDVEVLHVIGGGSRNRLLNRLTEAECGIPVIAGPSEATAIGNMLMQAVSCGVIRNRKEIKTAEWK